MLRAERFGVGNRRSLRDEMKLYPYPEPRFHLRKPPTGIPEGADVARYWDHSTEVIRWMGRNALRHLRDLDNRHEPFPDSEALADWILEIARPYSPHGDHLTGWAKTEFQAAEAAAYALDVYDHDHDSTERGRRGGKRSHRRSPLLARLRDLDDLSAAQQAERLGCSVRHVKRLRRKLSQEREEAEFLAELDRLVPLPSEGPPGPE